MPRRAARGACCLEHCRNNLGPQVKTPDRLLSRPPLISVEIYREVDAHANAVSAQVPAVACPSPTVSRGQSAGAVDDAPPGEFGAAGVRDPSDLAGRPRVPCEEGQLAVGHDPAPRDVPQDRVDPLAQGRRRVPDYRPRESGA